MEVGVMACEKKSKSNEVRIFPQNRQSRWIFFLALNPENVLLYIKVWLPQLPHILLIIWAILSQWKTLSFSFSCFKVSITPPLDRFYNFRKLVIISCISKRTCYFSLSFVMPEKQKSTVREWQKFTGSIYRILKTQKTISSAKISLTKPSSLIDFSRCDKYH